MLKNSNLHFSSADVINSFIHGTYICDVCSPTHENNDLSAEVISVQDAFSVH